MLSEHADAVALAISVGLVGAYYLYLWSRLRRDPAFTVHAVNSAARAGWATTMMSARGQEILAIQTLRNSVMSASFMASTAILLMVATLTLTGSQDHAAGLWHVLGASGASGEVTAVIKLMLLLADFFTAFFSFSMAVRFFNHVGYMITASGGLPGAVRPARVVAYLNRAGNCYAFGTRAFFFCVPLMLWTFGPSFLVAGTAALLLALYPFDRAPRDA
jgi:uncharacterized membrane protein